MPPETSVETIRDSTWIRNWYGDLARQFGDDYRSLGFNQPASQRKRFEALCEVGNLDGRRVLDVGCGLGHFCDFLQEKGLHVDYTGFDITPELITQAKRRTSEQKFNSCRFEVADTLAFEPRVPFDYVVASGIFGLLSENAEDRIAPTLQRLFSWSTRGMAVNFLSQRSTRQAEGRLYVDPARILSLGFDRTPAVRLNHNYLPNDFTIYLYRTPAWQQR